MRLILATVAATGLLVASASAAASPPEVISKPRDKITDLFLGADDLSWNWRDGGRAGSSQLTPDAKTGSLPAGGEVVRPAGLIPAPTDALFRGEYAAAYSHAGRLTAVYKGKRSVIARHRKGVFGEHFDQSTYKRAVIWSEGSRGLFGSASKSPKPRTNAFQPFTAPRRLAKGRVRIADLGVGTVAAMAWQDSRGRIRARRIKTDRILPPITIAKTSRRVTDLAVLVPYGTVQVVWSTSTGVRIASLGYEAKRFGKPVKLASRPASGIVGAPADRTFAFGAPGGIHFVAQCSDGLQQVVKPVPGTPHLDDYEGYPNQYGYTVDGRVHFGNQDLGAGHDLRIGLGAGGGDIPAGVTRQSFYWLRGAAVLRASIDTPERSFFGGSLGPSPCDDA